MSPVNFVLMEALPRLVGGDIALDLVNAVDPDYPGGDYLRAEADVAQWLAHVGLGGTARRADLLRARVAIDAALRPLAEQGSPDTAALMSLYARAVGRATLAAGGFAWATPVDTLVASAVELLAHGPVDRLKSCGNCPWLFLDLSRNNSRRWCSMEGCGTEVKIRRLTERRREAATGRRGGA